MSRAGKHYRWHMLCLGSMVFLMTFLVGCGGGASSASMGAPAAPRSMRASSSSNASGTVKQGGTSSSIGPRYLIKSLSINMEVKDTPKVADDLQAWISATDPLSSSAGINYQQEDTNVYNITMTYTVQASLYPKIETYLRDYAPLHGGHLLGINETVQDVTNTYVDTQSRLKTMQAERDRLIQLMSHAQALGDILSIEQRLTDVEQQIESTEASLNTLTSQVTFYSITISLQPLAGSSPQPTNPPWSIGQVFHDAIAASISLGEGLITFVIWLLAFSIYIIPATVGLWFLWRWRNRPRQVAAPKTPLTTPHS